MVKDGLFRRFNGGFGTVTIIAPPPWAESAEVPYMFVAATVANI